jgi:hypothetical protein
MGKHVRIPSALPVETFPWMAAAAAPTPAAGPAPGHRPTGRRARRAADSDSPDPATPVQEARPALMQEARPAPVQAARPAPVQAARPALVRPTRPTARPTPSLPARQRRPPGPYRPPTFPSERPDLDTLRRVLAALHRL